MLKITVKAIATVQRNKENLPTAIGRASILFADGEKNWVVGCVNPVECPREDTFVRFLFHFPILRKQLRGYRKKLYNPVKQICRKIIAH